MNDLLCETDIRLGSLGLDVVKQDGLSMTGRFTQAHVAHTVSALLDTEIDLGNHRYRSEGFGYLLEAEIISGHLAVSQVPKHAAMKHAAPVRKQLRFRTIFNLIGPLTNPAGAEFQLVGTGRKETAHRLARALAELGRRHAYVVCGADQLDEVSLWGTTTAFEVTGGQVREHHWTAKTFDLPECRVEELQVQSPAESAALIRDIFGGKAGAARNIVLANAPPA
jgi:anthranilate phosphoribosyltransferase